MDGFIVQTFIDIFDAEGMLQFAPADFDWNQPLGNDTPPPLLYAIFRFWSLGAMEATRKLEVIDRILQAGADPLRECPPGLKITVKNKEPLTLPSMSAVFCVCNLRKGTQDLGDAHPKRKFLEDVLALMKQAKGPKVKKASVHEAVVNLWESVREMSSTHNVIFETSDGEVSAHDHILMAASPVLRAMLQSAMKEGKDKRVQVWDSTKCGMTLFLDVLYTSSTCLELQYKTILEAFDLAHRWQVQHVTDILTETLKGEIRVESFAEIAEAAVLKAVEPLQRACMEFGTKDKEIQTLLKKNSLPPAVRKLLGQREAEDVTNWIQQVFELLDFKSKLTSVSFMVQCQAEQLFPDNAVVKLAAPGLYFVLSPILAILGIFLISSVVVYVFVPLARRRGVEFTEAAKKQKQREDVMEVFLDWTS
ncbi:klhl36, partial [Symbiodinium microadriaticum]